MTKTKRHFIIPDTQVRADEPQDHWAWIEEAVVEYQPDTLWHLGDHWDMPSLSRYDTPGSKKMANASYQRDVDSGNEVITRFSSNLKRRKVTAKKKYLLGNHDERVAREVNANPKYEGKIGYKDFALVENGWQVFDYHEVAWEDGIAFSHYFYYPKTGKPIGGSIDNRLNRIGCSFVQGHEQGFLYGNRDYPTGRTYHGLVSGSCLTPDHKVLTADLVYKPLGEVNVGDKLVSFDEGAGTTANRSRRFKTGTILAKKIEKDLVYKVTLASGKEFKVTADHRWLAKTGSMYMWRRTDNLRVGSCVPKIMEEWDTATSNDAGWLAGLFDGEGCLYTRKTCAGTVIQLSLSQKQGVVLDKAASIMKDFGLTASIDYNRDVASLRIKGGIRNITKVLGQFRPVRLLPKFAPEYLGGVCVPDNRNDKVVSIEKLGVQDIVRIEIDAKTMVVEGYGHHNCYLHYEDYKGHQGNSHFRGVVVLNGVRDGSYCIMPLDFNYLCEKYEGVPLSVYLKKKYKDPAKFRGVV